LISTASYFTDVIILQRVVILKDQVNKKAHAESAQLACEAAGSIRTVASFSEEMRMPAETRTFWNSLKDYLSTWLHFPLKESFWRLISFLGALIPRLVERLAAIWWTEMQRVASSF